MKRKPRHRSLHVRTVLPPALRLLSICVPAAFVPGPPTLAQDVEHGALPGGIPAQPLAQALASFASQTGLQLVYVSGIVRNQRAHAVPAGLDAAAALARMLEGTNLTFEYLTPRSIRIVAATVAPPTPARTPPPADSTLQEVIVSATRREENAQNVPMTIQVMTEAKLAQLNVTTFNDFVTYLPGVTAHGVGPSQSNIYVRGLATTTGGVQGSGVSGTFPNVAVYLNEQSAQLPNRNLDIYAVDLERIEVLEGPQGTLFGAGAEAGVVRYITNKPKLDRTEVKLSAGYAMTAHGAQSANLTATLNLPLMPGKLALRGTVYSDQRGGYMDNIPATFARAPTDLGIVNYFGGWVPTNSVELNNFNIAADHINPVSYRGLRVQGLYKFNDDWDALISQSSQSIEADGVFTEMATNALGQPQPELTAQVFNPSYDKDRFQSTALTIDGRVGALKLLYAGSYLARSVDQIQDYTQYARGPYVDYYQCVNPGPTLAAAQCFTPSSTWHDIERNTHLSHELRLSTPSEGRIRGIGGLFYENYRIQEQVDWFYLNSRPYFQRIGPPTGYYTLNGSPLLPDGTLVNYNSVGAVFVPSPVSSINPNLRPLGDGFFDDITRGFTQQAAYASVDAELIPKTLTLTIGTRFSRLKTSEVGATVGSFGCGPWSGSPAPDPCINHSNFQNIDAEHLNKTHSGFKSRANLSWKANDDALLYYTWSQGYRAGGFNRAPDGPSLSSPLAANGRFNQVLAGAHGGWSAAVAFAPDSLSNHELGWKTRWLDQRIQWNGALYQENWDQTQISLFGLGVINDGVIANGGNYRVRGVEMSGMVRIAAGLTIEANGAWSHSALVRGATFLWRDGTPIDFSLLQDGSGHPVADPNGPLGTPLAGAPPFQGNIRARYEFRWLGCVAFAQIAAMHQSHSLSSTFHLAHDLQGNSTVYDLPAFTTYEAALGVTRDAWLVQLYGENLTDTRGQLYAYYAQSYKAITVDRPRTIGMRVSYSLSGT